MSTKRHPILNLFYKITGHKKDIKVKSSAKTKKENIEVAKNVIDDIACKQIPNIEKNKILGKGTEGSVYCYVDDCSYVVKIQKLKYNETYKLLQKEVAKNNKASALELAPKIYKLLNCGSKAIILMDTIKGQDLWDFKNITSEDIDDLFDEIDKLHKNKIYHGDLNPSNIFITDKGLFKFIDFNIRASKYKPIYDYGTMLYYLKSMNSMNSKTAALFVDKIYKKLLPYKKDSHVKVIIDYMNKYNKNYPLFYSELKDLALEEFYHKMEY